MNKIDKNVLASAMTYERYVQKIKELLSEGKTSTSTINNSPNLIHYRSEERRVGKECA